MSAAARRDDGSYEIDGAELARCFPPRPARNGDATGDMVRHATGDATPDATGALIAELRSVIADLKTDRDAWRAVAERLTLAAPGRRWWRRLAG
jgi:hypothetical protein